MRFNSFLLLYFISHLLITTAAILPDNQVSYSRIPGKVLKETQKAFDLENVLIDGLRNHRLKKAHIISDTLDDFEPSCYLRVSYDRTHEEVFLGNKIKPSHTKEVPKIRIFCAKSKTAAHSNGYTIALTDPDAPSRKDPKWSEMCHWIATISSNGTEEKFYADDRDQKLKDIVEYKPPGPPPKTGYHRYVFVLLHGDITNLTAPSDRQDWGSGKDRHGIRDWAAKEGLEVVGANFFNAKNKKQ